MKTASHIVLACFSSCVGSWNLWTICNAWN